MKSLLITGLLAAFALAQPHGHNYHRRAHNHRAAHQHRDVHQEDKRDLKTHWVYETVWVTKTEYAQATKTVYMGKPKGSKDAQFHESQPKTTGAPKYDRPAPPPAVVLPPPPPDPKIEKPAAPPPPPPQAQAPPPVAAPAPAPVNNPAPSPPERNNGAGGGGGDYRSGEMTYYAVGLGSCGWNDAERKSEYIVAMNAPVMGAQSNGNPMCGRKVEISYNGKTIVAEVRDKCPECQPGDLDVSEGAFVALCGGTGAGRVKIQWKFV